MTSPASVSFRRQNPYPDLLCNDMHKEMGGWKNIGEPVKIGDHEVKAVGSLNILEKKPLGNYFGGTKEKKNTKRRAKPHKIKQSLSDFAKDMPQTELNGVETTESSQTSITSIKEEIIKIQLEHKIHEYIQMRQYNDRKCKMQQKLEEEDYIKEQENLAETWLKYIRGRKESKQKNSDDYFSQPNRPHRKTRIYKSRYFFRSQKLSNDDQDEVEKGKKTEETSLKRESGEDQSSFDELGQVLEKLVLVSEEQNFGWDSQQSK